jgi:hypothetical protein
MPQRHICGGPQLKKNTRRSTDLLGSKVGLIPSIGIEQIVGAATLGSLLSSSYMTLRRFLDAIARYTDTWQGSSSVPYPAETDVRV